MQIEFSKFVGLTRAENTNKRLNVEKGFENDFFHTFLLLPLYYSLAAINKIGNEK